MSVVRKVAFDPRYSGSLLVAQRGQRIHPGRAARGAEGRQHYGYRQNDRRQGQSRRIQRGYAVIDKNCYSHPVFLP